MTELTKVAIATYLRSRTNPASWDDFKEFFQLTDISEIEFGEALLELLVENRIKLVINKEVIT